MTNNSNNEPSIDLKRLSETLMKLGKEIETKLAEKQKLEQEIKAKQEKINEIRKLEREIFQDKQKLIELNSELQELGAQMKGIEERKSKSRI